MIRNRRWLSCVLCAAIAVVAIGLVRPIHANSNDVWIASVEGQSYQLECGQQEFTLSGDNMEQPKVVQGTLLGACSWEKKLWMLIGRQDGAYLASYMPYYQMYQEYTGEEGAPLLAGQEDFSLGVTTDSVFVYTDTNGTAVGYRVDPNTSLCTFDMPARLQYSSRYPPIAPPAVCQRCPAMSLPARNHPVQKLRVWMPPARNLPAFPPQALNRLLLQKTLRATGTLRLIAGYIVLRKAPRLQN